MAEIKTKPTTADVLVFLKSVDNEQKRADSLKILELMETVTGEEPVMWGNSIVGFGRYKYKNSKGEENVWPLIGFAQHKKNLTLYIMTGFDRYDELLGKLEKHFTGKSCLFINKLADVNADVLEEISRLSFEEMKKQHS